MHTNLETKFDGTPHPYVKKDFFLNVEDRFVLLFSMFKHLVAHWLRSIALETFSTRK
jgi:hypothetical protein